MIAARPSTSTGSSAEESVGAVLSAVCLLVALLVADGGLVPSSASPKEAVELRPLRPLPPPPSDSPGGMGRVVAQSIIAFSAPAAALGALGAMGAILRALSGRADIFKCGLPPLLLWRVISIPKGRNVEARLFIRRLSTCSLTDDLFQPVVEIARRTFPRLALLLFHERPDSINVLFAKPCSPVGTGNGPVGRSAVERPLRSSVLSIPASSAPAHR